MSLKDLIQFYSLSIMVMGKVDQKATGASKHMLGPSRGSEKSSSAGQWVPNNMRSWSAMHVGWMWGHTCGTVRSCGHWACSLWDGAWPPLSHGVAGPGAAERMESVNLARILKWDLLTGVEVTSILGISIIVENLKAGQKRRWDTIISKFRCSGGTFATEEVKSISEIQWFHSSEAPGKAAT